MSALLRLTTGVVYVRNWSGTLSGSDLGLTGDLTVTNAAIGVTTNPGITLQNTTAAADGAQQYSPGLSFIGQGWKTNATAASQQVETRWELRPVQGSAGPTYQYVLMGRINNGSWSDLLTVNSSGQTLHASGSASAPSIGFAGDVDTGMYLLADTMGYTVGSTPLFSVYAGALRSKDTQSLEWGASAVAGDATLVLSRVASGTLGISNATNVSTVTVSATGGVALSSHAVSLAQDATTKVGTAPVGILTVVNTTDSSVAQFSLIGTGVVAELHDSSGAFSVTKDNASTINVYYDTNGVYVQNKITATKSVRLILEGV